MTSPSNSSQSTCPKGRVLWEELLVLSRFHSLIKESGQAECLSAAILSEAVVSFPS